MKQITKVLNEVFVLLGIRKVFIPKSVAEMLEKIKASQDEMKGLLGKDYHKYDLVIATDYGLPLGEAAIRKRFKKLIKEHNLPGVVFHSLRHSSVTYKLKLNGGDIKAVQGDSGHAQVNKIREGMPHSYPVFTFLREGREGEQEILNQYDAGMYASSAHLPAADWRFHCACT